MVEELFLNPRRKTIRVGRDKGGLPGHGQFSRIETEEEEDDSGSSIQENVTYVALQNMKFPWVKVNNNNPLSRDVSPDRQEDKASNRKSKAAFGLGALGLVGLGFGEANLGQQIEFFDPIKPKGALSKTKGTGKIKDKGST